MTLPRQSTRIFLSERPNGPISDGTFKLATTVLPRPAVDQVVVRVDYISLDPAMRLWLDDARSYLPPIQIGETIRAPGVGTVVQGNSQLKEADTVYGFLGWAEYIIAPAKDLRKISPPEGAAVTDFLGPLGFNGMSACFGLLSVGKIKAGETLVVSGAAGATGSLVCQNCKIKGARVIGLASTLKCSYLVNQLGVDAALDYTSPTFAKRFLRYCRQTQAVRSDCLVWGDLDVQFWWATLWDQNYPQMIFQKARAEGFLATEYIDQYAEAEAEMFGWMNEGKLVYKYHIEEGLERCPEYLGLLFSGGNEGKLLVKVSGAVTSPETIL
ncbi:N-terminal domain of oxidoreductase [Rhizoctonia solani]|uniref:N-terminal domain of oxidoreductase n=1 Tax=Rhizoctonia solani TaxID=456999 RepID=A0A8H7M1P6_9AGAM|nr:N-terminal domain of oxidoreductase [Rhizoctonia solani]